MERRGRRCQSELLTMKLQADEGAGDTRTDAHAQAAARDRPPDYAPLMRGLSERLTGAFGLASACCGYWRSWWCWAHRIVHRGSRSEMGGFVPKRLACRRPQDTGFAKQKWNCHGPKENARGRHVAVFLVCVHVLARSIGQ